MFVNFYMMVMFAEMTALVLCGIQYGMQECVGQIFMKIKENIEMMEK